MESKTFASWISLTFLCSVLCMWTTVEGWSYYHSDTKMNWNDARAWCREKYTDMVAIQNQEEIMHLGSSLPKIKGYYWIGIRKVNNVWTWVGTNKTLTAEATNWAKGEPNNGKSGPSTGESEDCVEMYIKRDFQPNKWNDERCGKNKTALCYAAACQSDSCSYGDCVETINSHRCACFDGFYGERCEQVVKCDKNKITIPYKGSVECTHQYGNFSYNSSCQYSCEEGYQLSTSGPLTCNAFAEWSEQPPTCELVQCQVLSRPERGSMTCSDPLGSSSYQSTCVFTCDEGYILRGSPSNTLQCEASGMWNASQPFCAVVRCPAFQELENGVASCGENADVRFSYRSTCSFSCAPGYRLLGPSTVTCTSKAEWSETMMPRCEAITCKSPDRGTHLIPQCSQSVTELRPDSSCSFSCEAGFELQGAQTLQCSEDGQWNEAIPTCRVVQCQVLSHPEKGSMTCSDPLGSSSYQSTCVFTCDEGYVVSGTPSNILQCEASGMWNASQPFCAAVQCPAFQELENGVASCGENADVRFSYGNTCSFSCAPGYRLLGQSTVTCTAKAEWSETMMPRCEAITCKSPDREAHLIPQCSQSVTELRPDSSCSFSCEAGFELQGAQTIQCSEDGQWNEAIPTCRAVPCPLLEAPENGHINCSDSEQTYEAQCSFTCSQDYSLHGHEVLSCDRHGNWTGEKPTCQAPPTKIAAVASGVAAGGTLTVSALSLAAWILKKMKNRATKFELSSNSDIDVPEQVYKNSIDSLI